MLDRFAAVVGLGREYADRSTVYHELRHRLGATDGTRLAPLRIVEQVPVGRREGESPRRILAVASSGGHWAELLRMSSALRGHDVTWVTTNPGYRERIPFGTFHAVRDASMWDKKGLVVMLAQIALLMRRARPDIVISTGAAPGYFALRLGRLFGSRTVWVDSIANADDMSLSGKEVGPFADLWLTQWDHLARPNGPHYAGKVL